MKYLDKKIMIFKYRFKVIFLSMIDCVCHVGFYVVRYVFMHFWKMSTDT